MENSYVIILAGGGGSRLWPLSNESHPKQLLKLEPVSNKSFIQLTYERALKITSAENILLVTNQQQQAALVLQIKELYPENELQVISEPSMKNTAPAVTLAFEYIKNSFYLNQEFNAIVTILASDHLIVHEENFHSGINKAKELAKQEKLVTLGIKPSTAHTGYGYIECAGTEVISFKEKPSIELANKYLIKGNYYWNSGMLVVKGQFFLDEMQKYSPDILKIIQKEQISQENSTISQDAYMQCENISLDYALLEKSDKLACVLLNIGWDDCGSWQSIYDILQKDQDGNAIHGKVINLNCKNSLVYSKSKNKLIAIIGLDNVIVVETEDAILVCDKHNTQDVKKITEILKD